MVARKAKPMGMGQKAPAPRAKRRITTRRFTSFSRDKLRPERARTQPRPPRDNTGGLGDDGCGRSTYERKPASLFDGCRLSSPLRQGIQAR